MTCCPGCECKRATLCDDIAVSSVVLKDRTLRGQGGHLDSGQERIEERKHDLHASQLAGQGHAPRWCAVSWVVGVGPGTGLWSRTAACCVLLADEQVGAVLLPDVRVPYQHNWQLSCVRRGNHGGRWCYGGLAPPLKHILRVVLCLLGLLWRPSNL